MDDRINGKTFRSSLNLGTLNFLLYVLTVSLLLKIFTSTVNSRFKKDLKLKIHLHKAFFSDDRFLDSLHKSFLNQTTLDLRKEKWTFLNREFTVLLLVATWENRER